MIKKKLFRITLGSLSDTLLDSEMKMVLGGSGCSNCANTYSCITCNNGNTLSCDNYECCDSSVISLYCQGGGKCETCSRS